MMSCFSVRAVRFLLASLLCLCAASAADIPKADESLGAASAAYATGAANSTDPTDAADAVDCERGFSVVAPERATTGGTTVVLVSLHGAAAASCAVNVTLRLVERPASAGSAQQAQQLLAQVTHRITGQGLVPLRIPEDAEGSFELHTLLACNRLEGCARLHASPLRVFGAVREVLLRGSRRHYLPGQLVRFWALALDPELRTPRTALGQVFVLDPAGNKVALWNDLTLEQGVRHFEVRLSGGAPSGQWRLVAAVGHSVFTQHFHVSRGGPQTGAEQPLEPRESSGPRHGAVDSAQDDSETEVALAEEHYVELKFGRGMRRVYKPGLPFAGNVVAVSTEKSVRVRVKVYDNTTAIYSQDIEISSGEGRFIVPAILADGEVITLQAELVSVDGKEIDSHYVLAKEPIKKWESFSDCYLLVEPINTPLLPDEEFDVHVLSTCSCDLPAHVVVTTNGVSTYWNQLPIPGTSAGQEIGAAPVRSVLEAAGAAGFCRLNFSFTVQAQMAPSSSLLVYYVTPEGEPISDVITFTVSLVHPQITLSVEERDYWTPTQAVNVGISSPISSLVCLIGGRGSTSPSKSVPGPAAFGTTPGADFLAAGLTLFQQPKGRPSHFFTRSDSDERPWPLRVGLFAADTQLDQLWVWKCFNFSDEMIGKGVVIAAPSEPGQWTLRAMTVSPTSGLRLSPARHVLVFRPIHVTMSLPAEIHVGETVQVDIRISNQVDSCVDVTALLSLTEGAHFVASKALFVTEKLRLGPRGATSLVVRLRATTPGVKNITAEVSGFGSDSCREVTTTGGGNSTREGSPMGSSAHTASTTVLPEGLLNSDTESAYFCANENVLVSPAESSHYEWVPAPRNRQGLMFEVKSAGGARVALSEVDHVADSMYQLVIGDDDNSATWIGRGNYGFGVHLASVETRGLLSTDEFRTFWVSWAHNSITLGLGPVLGVSPILTLHTERAQNVRHVGFSSSWATSAEFRAWNYNDEAGFSQVLHLDVPRHSVVPGTEQGTLLVAGGLALPPTSGTPQANLDVPASLTSSIARLTSLAAASSSDSDIENISAQLALGVQDLMSFRKADSSFGEHPTIGSHHSTVLVLSLLSRAQFRVQVDPDLLARTKSWLQRAQLQDGSFQSDYRDDYPGQDVTEQEEIESSASQLKLDRDVIATSESVSALLQVGVDDDIDSDVLLRARYFLERNLYRVNKPCPVAMLTYALAASKSELATAALDRLRNVSTNEEGEFGWPHPQPPKDNPNWLYEESSSRHNKEPIHTSVIEYRAALFALKTYSLLGDLKSAEPVARYLFYRSHLLDTHVELALPAVWAFSAFGALALDSHRSLTVSLATSGMELTDTLELRSTTAAQPLQLPSLPTKVFVYATGAGCATVKGRVSYSSYAASRRAALLAIWAEVEEEKPPARNSLDSLEGKLPMLRIRVCARWAGSEASGLLRIEVALFSGFQLVSVVPQEAHEGQPRAEMHYGSRGRHVWFVVTSVSPSCAWCVRFTARSDHVVGALRPAHASVFPAQRPDLAAHTFFHTGRGSPLLTDVTDDDLITWFASEDSDHLELSSNFTDVCECWKPCSNMTNATSTANTTNMAFTASTETNFNYTTTTAPEESVQYHQEIIDEEISSQSNETTSQTNETTFQPNETPFQTNETYSQSNETALQPNEISYQSNETTSKSNGTSEPNTTTDRPVTLTPRASVLNVQILNDTVMSVNTIKKNVEEKKGIPKKKATKLNRKNVVLVGDKPADRPMLALKSISEVAGTTVPVPQTTPAQTEANQLVVVDRDTLWGMLKEVINVELDKKQSEMAHDNAGNKNEI